MEDDGRIYYSAPRHFGFNWSGREAKWRSEVLIAAKRRTNMKVINSNRRAALGKPPRWPYELYTMELPWPVVDRVEEPEPATPDPRLLGNTDFSGPFSKLKAWAETFQGGRSEEDTEKAMLTQVTTAIGDHESFNNIDDLYERIDEEEMQPSTFNFKAAEEERLWREKAAKRRQLRNLDYYLLAQVFDSCPLQGEVGLAANLGEFFPRLLDAGDGQVAHKFWHGQGVCPELGKYWEAAEFRADKLFVPVDRSNLTFMKVISLWKQLDQTAAVRKRAVAAYYCCFAVFYGQKPKQSAHVEHECLKHDLDKRIVTKPRYDHAEDLKYDNSVNTAKKILGFVKEQGEGLDEVDAYLHAWKRLAGKGRWWFKDSFTGQEWIAVPWFWKHTEPTEECYLKHFDRCFADKHYSIYLSSPPPAFGPDPEAVFDIKASVLARKSTSFRTGKKSFKEVAAIIWLTHFKEPLGEAKKRYGQVVEKLGKMSVGDRSNYELQMEDNEDELLQAYKEFIERMKLVFRATSIVFERAARLCSSDDLEIEISSEPEKCRQQVWRDTKQTDLQKKNAAEKKAAADKRRRENTKQNPELRIAAREKERLRKASQRAKAARSNTPEGRFR